MRQRYAADDFGPMLVDVLLQRGADERPAFREAPGPELPEGVQPVTVLGKPVAPPVIPDPIREVVVQQAAKQAADEAVRSGGPNALATFVAGTGVVPLGLLVSELLKQMPASGQEIEEEVA